MSRRWAAGLVAAAALAASCGAVPELPAAPTPAPTPAPGATAPTGTEHNGSDVVFLQMMVAHHGQGLEMARLAADRADGADVRTLAAAVDVTQTDELAAMTGWLAARGEPVEVDIAPGAHAGHGGLPATGPAEVATLRTASGPAFDTAFRTLFAAHQHGAVEMAQRVLTTGLDAEVAALAGRIRDSRTDQIRMMLTAAGS